MGIDPCVAPVDSLSSDQERDRQKTHRGKQYVVTPSSEQSNHNRSPRANKCNNLVQVRFALPLLWALDFTVQRFQVRS
jgi:hypothetical protein